MEARSQISSGKLSTARWPRLMRVQSSLAEQRRVQIESARLPQIGTVSRSQDGSFTVGPIPGLGVPFNTAASFIRAWFANAKYPASRLMLVRSNSPYG
ncbi:unnamed protein product [Clonostachys rosea f. rosea IK726]|uniref:Uncharacterized protein n=1 Tax=Clonostachys rosea f. rosea IK726 TaxID=1349383 RepID=A0ACA9U0J9_BIOOC|nr:unnamed protein product [Clonostachys rosea f. rosea IK726]